MSARPATVLRRGATNQLRVVLTFDAGSDAGFTSSILDTLSANGIVAAFGITGRWAEQNPSLMRRISNEGHEFINHSYDHASFTGQSTGLAPLTRSQRWQQLDRTEQIVSSLTGRTTNPYFRPPYGDYDASVNVDIGARGYRYNVMWTVDSGGWRGIPAQAIAQRCLSLAVPGATYVFHVGSASQDAAALQPIINGLRARGYSFARLSEFAP
jgi:peptidoglycan/xylan/chitin deacetylase (PgdA/CDA1 family)